MSLNDLLREGRLRRHSASPGEIVDLLLKAQRALADAQQGVISTDHRFVIGYHGLLHASTAALAAAGYWAAERGYHATTFEALPLVVPEAAELAGFLDACRRKRNRALYDRVGEVSEGEVQELADALGELLTIVKQWLQDSHPELYPSPRRS